MTGENGHVVVEQQADGWWRWRFEPRNAHASALVSGEAYEDQAQAVESAGKAYPDLRPYVAEPMPEHHRIRTGARRLSAAVLVAFTVVAAARAGRRRRTG